jgi:multisubunit Na+/H+ antiporter MnhC subunit
VTQCINILSTGGATDQPTPPHSSGNTTTQHDGFKLPLGLILTIIGIALAILVVTAVVALIIRMRDMARQSGITGAPPPALAEEAEDESALAAAMLAGRSALEGEARAAIIACYAAMEDSLAMAGVPRLESDSPSDLLARATRRGVVDGPAPRLLAKLFREARFSTHPMDARHLDEARGALDAITEQLTARQEAESQSAAAGAST